MIPSSHSERAARSGVRRHKDFGSAERVLGAHSRVVVRPQRLPPGSPPSRARALVSFQARTPASAQETLVLRYVRALAGRRSSHPCQEPRSEAEERSIRPRRESRARAEQAAPSGRQKRERLPRSLTLSSRHLSQPTALAFTRSRLIKMTYRMRRGLILGVGSSLNRLRPDGHVRAVNTAPQSNGAAA